MLEATAETLLLLGLRLGDLDIMGELTAMCPDGTIILAATAAGERLTRAQWLGLALAAASMLGSA